MPDAGVWPSVLSTRRRGVGGFVPPTPDAREAIRHAVRELLTRGEAGRAAAEESAARAGYAIVAPADLGDRLLLRELETERRGGGAYVIDLARRAQPLAIQAPHTLFETGTLAIACDLFDRAGAAAVFLDTVHRYHGAIADADHAHPADNAHNEETLFQGATLGLLDAHPAATVVQIHGFGDRDDRDPRATAILSSGTAKSGDPLVARVAAALAPRLEGVVRYPDDWNRDDWSDLGGTKNVQGRAVRRSGGRFLHIELQRTLRKTLPGDPALRAQVLGPIAAALLAVSEASDESDQRVTSK